MNLHTSQHQEDRYRKALIQSPIVILNGVKDLQFALMSEKADLSAALHSVQGPVEMTSELIRDSIELPGLDEAWGSRLQGGESLGMNVASRGLA